MKSYKESKQAQYKKRKPWVRFVEFARRRCNDLGDNYKTYGAKGIKCHLTAADLELIWHRDNAVALKRPSLDRIDSNKDYEIGNVRFIEFNLNARMAWDPNASVEPEFT